MLQLTQSFLQSMILCWQFRTWTNVKSNKKIIECIQYHNKNWYQRKIHIDLKYWRTCIKSNCVWNTTQSIFQETKIILLFVFFTCKHKSHKCLLNRNFFGFSGLVLRLQYNSRHGGENMQGQLHDTFYQVWKLEFVSFVRSFVRSSVFIHGFKLEMHSSLHGITPIFWKSYAQFWIALQPITLKGQLKKFHFKNVTFLLGGSWL
jgi:hypothetical protein